MTIRDKDLLLVGMDRPAIYDVKNDAYIFGDHLVFKVYDKKKKWLPVEGLSGAKLPGLDYYDRINSMVKLPEGQWEPVGLYPGLTEEQCAKLVPQNKISGKYHDYIKSKLSVGKYGACFLDTALESFASRMEALGAYTKNPMDKPKHRGQWVTKEGIDNEYNEYQYSKKYKLWLDYQSRTSNQFLILKKK